MEDPPAAAPAAVAVAADPNALLLNAQINDNKARIIAIEAEIRQLRRGILGGVINAGQIADLRAEKTFLMQQNTEFGNQIAAIGVAQAQPPVQAQAVPPGTCSVSPPFLNKKNHRMNFFQFFFLSS